MNHKCKGARDLIPEDMKRFRYIEDAFRSSCIGWGYQEVRSPTIEYLHLFTSAGTLTPSMLNKVYSFLDWDGWSGERVVLRPDGTIPVARLYIENLLKQEISRLFYVTNVFAFEETGKENRERWQCGIELMGNDKPASDVEIIMLALEIIHNLHIEDVQIQLSHAGMLKTVIKEMMLSLDEEKKLLNEIRDGNWKILTKTKTRNSNIRRLLPLLLDLRGKSSGYLENLKALPGISSELKTGLDNFAQITKLLDTLGCCYRIDITSTRGFEYYTGLCFQLLLNDQNIGGGGRYNDLIPLVGGPATPACGFALYVDPLLHAVKAKVGQSVERGVLIKESNITPKITKACFTLAQSLRNIGYIVEFGTSQIKWRWVVTAQQKSPLFVINDQFKKQKSGTSSIDAVLDIIGGSS